MVVDRRDRGHVGGAEPRGDPGRPVRVEPARPRTPPHPASKGASRPATNPWMWVSGITSSERSGSSSPRLACTAAHEASRLAWPSGTTFGSPVVPRRGEQQGRRRRAAPRPGPGPTAVHPGRTRRPPPRRRRSSPPSDEGARPAPAAGRSARIGATAPTDMPARMATTSSGPSGRHTPVTEPRGKVRARSSTRSISSAPVHSWCSLASTTRPPDRLSTAVSSTTTDFPAPGSAPSRIGAP